MDSKELKRNVGQRVRQFRLQEEYSLFQFAELMDISVNFLSEIENGKKAMSQETICRLCEKFNLSADYILFGVTPDAIPYRNLIETVNNFSDRELSTLSEYIASLQKMRRIQNAHRTE